MATEKNQLLAEVVLDTQQMERQLRVIRGGLDKLAQDAKQSFNKTEISGGQLEKQVNKLSAGFTAFRASVLGVVAAGAGIAVAFTKATKAAAEWETVTKRLDNTLKNIGITSPAVTKSFIDMANGLERTTRFSDDAIIKLQTLLLNLGVAPDQISKVSKVTLDVATAFGRDIDSVGRAIAKTYSGYGREIGQIVPKTKELTEAQLKSGEAVRMLAKDFTGFAEKDALTFAGSIDQAKNSVGDFFKELGKFITESSLFQAALRGIKGAFDGIADSLKRFNEGGTTATTSSLSQERQRLQDELKNIANRREPSSFREMELQESNSDRKQTILNRLKEIDAQLVKTAATEKKVTEEAEKQVAAVSNKIRKEVQSNDLIEKRNKLEEEFSEVQDSLLDPYEKARKELAARLDVLERAQRAELRSDRELTEARKRSFESYDRDVRELRDKEHQDELKRIKQQQKERLDKTGTGLEVAAAVGEGGLSGLLKGVGTAVGGPVGDLIKLFGSVPDIASALAKTFPTLIGDTIKEIGGVFADLGGAIGGFFQDFGGLSDLFGFNGREFQSTMSEAIADAMDGSKFAGAIDRLIESLSGVAAQFRTTAQQLSAAQGLPGGNVKGAIGNIFDQVRLKGNFNLSSSPFDNVSGSNITDILAAGVSPEALKGAAVKIRDPEKFQQAIEELDQALLAEANRIAQITNLRIRLAQEEAQVLIDLNNNALKPIQENIAKLSTAKGAIGQAISQVSGVIAGPEATLAGLQSQFAKAKGGAKGDLAIGVKDALLQKLSAAQNLASIGAISGESLALEQAAILTELKNLKKQTGSELKKQEAKEDALLKANKKIESELQKQTEQMRADAEKQITALEDIAKELKAGNLVEFIKKGGSFASGTNFVPQTGFHLLHQGEMVISPQNKTQSGMGGGVNIFLSGNFSSGDDFVAQLISAIKQNKGNIVQQMQKKVKG